MDGLGPRGRTVVSAFLLIARLSFVRLSDVDRGLLCGLAFIISVLWQGLGTTSYSDMALFSVYCVYKCMYKHEHTVHLPAFTLCSKVE